MIAEMSFDLPRLRPLTARFRAKITKDSWRSSVEEEIVLDRGRTWTAKPLLAPENEVLRIKNHHRDADVHLNLQLFECRSIFQGPTAAFRLRDVLIADGQVLGRSWVINIRDQKRHLVKDSFSALLDTAGLSSTHPSERYFGHWLRDQLPTELLIRDWDLPSIALPSSTRPSEPGYRNITGLQAIKQDNVYCRNLWIFADHQITDHRVERIQRLRSRIRRNANGTMRRIYISRGKLSSGRALENENEVAQALIDRGFSVLECENASASQIADVLNQAEIVVGPEGSAFANAYMCAPPDAKLITLQSPDHVNLHYRIYCEAIGMRFGLLIGDSTGAQSFKIDVDRLETFIENL